MSAFGFGWRTALLAWVAFSLVLVVLACVAIQFDSQYDANGIVERVFVGLLGGFYGAALLSPFTLVLSVIVGCVASGYHRVRSRS